MRVVTESASHAVGDGSDVLPNHLVPEFDELAHLRVEVEQLKEQQRELMQLIGAKRADRLIHDVRNLLQEMVFLEAANKRALVASAAGL